MRLILIGLLLAACGPRAEPYPAEYEYNFLRACQAAESLEHCTCLWEHVEAEIPRADFERFDRLGEAERAAHPLRRDIESFALQCARQEGTLAP